MKKASMKNLLLSLGILAIVVPAATMLISCGNGNPGDGDGNPGDGDGNPGDGGDTKPPVIPPVDNRLDVNWSEEAITSMPLDSEVSIGGKHENKNWQQPSADTHKIGEWVDGEDYAPDGSLIKVWKPVIYNLALQVDSYQTRTIDDESLNQNPLAEAKFTQGFTADIPVYFNELGSLSFVPTQKRPVDWDGYDFLEWTGKTSNPDILYTTNGWDISFLNKNGEGMSYNALPPKPGSGSDDSGNISTLTLSINYENSNMRTGSYNDMTEYIKKDQTKHYGNLPNMKEDKYYEVLNSKFSFTISKPINTNQDK